MDPRTWFKGLTPYFLYVVFVATIGPMLFGYHLAELNTPQEIITCKRKSLSGSDLPTGKLPQCIPMDAAQLGVVSSMFTLGGFLGALAAGPLGNKYGRLRTMLATCVPFIIGPVFEALAPSIPVMAFGRLISGFGAGASVVVVPIYISEISPPAEKGFFGSLTQVMTNMGIFVTQLLGYLLGYGQMWRVVLAVGGAIGAAGLVGLLFSAESPKWLADQGKARNAKQTLVRIRGDGYDVEEEFASWGSHGQADGEEEQTLLGDEDGRKPRRVEHLGMWQCVRDPDIRKAVIGVIAIMTAQQLTGKHCPLVHHRPR